MSPHGGQEGPPFTLAGGEQSVLGPSQLENPDISSEGQTSQWGAMKWQ